MRIVYCIAGTYNSGGMERVLANKANFFVNLGNEITIVTSDQKNRVPYFHLSDAIKQIDLGINYCDTVNANFIKKASAYKRKQRSHEKKLNDLLMQLKADIVISMFDHEISFLYKIKDGSKKIVEIHFSRYKRLQYGRKGLLGLIDQYRSKQDLFLVKQYDSFVVLTKEDKGYWGELQNISVIPNANSFESTEIAALQNKQAIAVGRYDYQKGFEDLINIWELVHQQEPAWKLNIYGKGELQSKFEQMINERNLEASIQLCSPIKDIQNAYLSSSMCLLTSRYEGLPMTLLEAQACGLPLVAYACKCGPKDIIQDDVNGYLIEEGDQKSMAEKIVFLIQETEKRMAMGREAKRLSSNFGEEKVMQQWISLFNKLLS